MKLIAIIIMGSALFLGACSSSQTNDGNGDEVPSADAGTDAVPQASAEAPAPDANGGTSADALPPAGDAPAPVADNSAPPPAPNGSDATPPAAAPTPPTDPMAAAAPATPPAADSGALAAATPPAADDKSSEPAAPTAPAETDKTADAAPAPAAGESSGAAGSYTVHKGDTLMKIAFENYGDLYKWKQIYEANKDKIKDPNVIPAGVVLNLDGASGAPPEKSGEKYMIKQGDTLGTISKDVYGTPKKWKKIWQNNKGLIKDPNRIFAGFYLYYQPDGSKAQPEDDNGGGGESTAPAPMAQQDNSAPAAAPIAAPMEAPRAPAAVQPPQGLQQAPAMQQAQPMQQAPGMQQPPQAMQQPPGGMPQAQPMQAPPAS